ncbi:MAG TPA: cation:proton antiporter [Dehalococcoidia bacterium]
MQSTDLLVNLVTALAVAFAGGLLAARLGQSAVLGYLLAGMAIGPYTPGFVGDVATVDALANIGIILLLFAIGVQLSFRDLLRVGPVALVGGTVQVVLIIGLGYGVGLALGWSHIQSLFLGAVVSNSSSTVISKVLGDRGEAGSPHGQIALAWSTVQDLGTVVLVVVLSSLAGAGDGLVTDLLWSTGKATAFLLLAVPAGVAVLPWFFARVAALRQREIFVLAVAAVAFGTAYVSSFFGLSLALGAFVAGVVVGESDLSHQILAEVLPLRDIFSGLFFVSIGMLVDPGFVLRNVPLVLLVAGLIVGAKGLLSGAIIAVAGYPARTAALAGAALAQSAEFSFLLARLGTDLGAVSSTAFSLMLSGAVASIVTAPGLHRLALPLAAWLDVRLPARRLPEALEPPSAEAGRVPVVICGYGRVGRMVGTALRRRGLSFVVIEQDRRVVESLWKEGVPAYQGSAENRVLLERVGLERAKVLVVAIPDPVAARQLVDHAREVNPRLDIVARAYSEEERAFLEERGVTEAVVAERELALELTRHTLRRMGVGTLEIQALLQRLRGGRE